MPLGEKVIVEGGLTILQKVQQISQIADIALPAARGQYLRILGDFLHHLMMGFATRIEFPQRGTWQVHVQLFVGEQDLQVEPLFFNAHPQLHALLNNGQLQLPEMNRI